MEYKKYYKKLNHVILNQKPMLNLVNTYILTSLLSIQSKTLRYRQV